MPAAVLHALRRTVDRLKAEASDPRTDEFVQEVNLPIDGDGDGAEVTPPVPPILDFGPDTWTHTGGTYGTVDDRGRTALVVGEGTDDEATWATFTADLPITAGSDWRIVLWATGEINDEWSAMLVEESGGMDMHTTLAHGIYEGTIRSGSVSALNTEAWSPSLVEYVAAYTGGTTTISIYGVAVASGSGVAASGAGSVTVKVPPGAAIFALAIYDYV